MAAIAGTTVFCAALVGCGSNQSNGSGAVGFCDQVMQVMSTAVSSSGNPTQQQFNANVQTGVANLRQIYANATPQQQAALTPMIDALQNLENANMTSSVITNGLPSQVPQYAGVLNTFMQGCPYNSSPTPN